MNTHDEFDINKIKAAARRALIFANPNYYSLTETEQEKFRATLDGQHLDKVSCSLINDLLDTTCTLETLNDILENYEKSAHEITLINWAELLTTGVGDDYIHLNESMAENTSILDFNTIYDYDYEDYLYQVKSRKEENPEYKETPYYAVQFNIWVRLLIEDTLNYATITSLSKQMIQDIEEAGDLTIQRLIPSKFVEGKSHGKQSEDGILWNMESDANGHEPQLRKLRKRWYTYLQKCMQTLNSKFKNDTPTIYRLDEKSQPDDFYNDPDPFRLFIFNNEAATKKVRWKHFLADCKPLEKDYSELANTVAKEIEKASMFLAETHKDIIENFDPTIVEFRKKKTITMKPDVFNKFS